MLNISRNTKENHMLRSIVAILKEIFFNPVMKNDLDAYIVAGNPKDASDVERLERDFHNQRRLLARYYD